MAQRIRTIQTAFTAGELSDQLSARKDTQAYYVGCKHLTNVLPSPQGPAKVRPGSRFIGNLPGPSRFAVMVVNETLRYIIVFSGGVINIYSSPGHALSGSVASPYSADDIDTITWANTAGSLMMAQPNHPLQVLVNDPVWAIASYVFEAPPQQRYAARDVTLQPSSASGTATVTASAAVFRPDSVGEIWEIGKKRWTITAYTDSTHVTATVGQTLPGTVPTTDWTQQAASVYGGYFRAIAFHEGRLWLGGTERAQARLWGSRVGQPYNFQLITGTSVADDDGVATDASSGGRLDAINHLVSGSGGLEVFTIGHEGLVPSGPNDPITPAKIKYRPQSRYGSRRIVRPTKLDSQTLFAQVSGGAIREFIYSDVEQAYQSVPLTVRATHLVDDPVSMDSTAGGFNTQTDYMIVINADGTGAMMTSQRSENVAAWGNFESKHKLRRVASIGALVYLATEDPAGGWHFEFMDPLCRFDSQQDLSSPVAKTAWSGAVGLEGELVELWADGYDRAPVQVDGVGNFTTPEPYSQVSVGHAFDVEITPMAVDTPSQSLLGTPKRPIRAYIQHVRTTGLRVNGRVVPDRGFAEAPFNAPAPSLDGTVQMVSLKGWRRDARPLATLTREGSGPFEIVAFSLDVAIST